MKRLVLVAALLPGLGLCQAKAGGARRPSPNPAAAPAPVPDHWPIQNLSVEGNRNYTPQQILAVAGLKKGQMAGKEEFEAARDRLVASGMFETVGYRFAPDAGGKGYSASFQVTEVEPAYPVRFEELQLSDADLEAALRARDPLFSKAKLPATKAVLDRYASYVTQILAAKGISESVVARVVPGNREQYEILFRPARNLPAVAQVTFQGNQVVPQNILRDAISGVAVGQPYTEDHFRELLNTAVRPVYEGRGRIRVSFPEIKTQPAGDVNGLHVFVTVDEGQSYNLGKITTEGPSPVKPDDLLKAGDFKTGDVANFDRINEGIERVRKLLRRNGYLDAKVTPERTVDEDKKTVDLALRIEPGRQFTMGRLTIAGLDLNGEFEMRRIWALKEGKAFNPEYPDSFLNRIHEEGLFDNLGETKAEIALNREQHTADVTLKFSGGTSTQTARPKRPLN